MLKMDNFDLRKYLAKNKLLKEDISVDLDDDGNYILSGESGEYEGVDKDGKVNFSIFYEFDPEEEEDLAYNGISSFYDENDIEDFLGEDHAFVELAKRIPVKWDILDDSIDIEANTEDLNKIK
jgi:hypothetical protein